MRGENILKIESHNAAACNNRINDEVKSFDAYGKGKNGTKLIFGKIYSAKRKGDEKFSTYRAVKNGALFSMWPVDKQGNRCGRPGGYQLPHWMDFE